MTQIEAITKKIHRLIGGRSVYEVAMAAMMMNQCSQTRIPYRSLHDDQSLTSSG